jgi:hypothetical protein
MGFLAEMLALAVVWLSSIALCQFGVSVEHRVCPHAKNAQAKTVARTPRVAPIAMNAPIVVARPAAREA